MTDPAAPLGLLLSDDLIFTSRVTATARDLGLLVKPARSAEAVVALARQQSPRCVIVDLANPGLVLTELVARLAEVCGHIAGLPLNRDRPLWEMWVIEGGAGADSLALLLKAHHAVVDGISGVNLLANLSGTEPEMPPAQAAAAVSSSAASTVSTTPRTARIPSIVGG